MFISRAPNPNQRTPSVSPLSLAASSVDSSVDPVVLHPSCENGLKRLIDIAGALVGLGTTALLLPWIVFAIRKDGKGPIFYSQMRCGLNGKPFRMWKFRSMIPEADRLQHLVANQAKGNIFKNNCDPRITKIGRFLRRPASMNSLSFGMC